MRFSIYTFSFLSLFLARGGFAGYSTPVPVAPPNSINPSIPSVVTATGDAYVPGVLQMVASAKTISVILHPQGRYALIIQNEAAPPPEGLFGKPTTGAVTLFLYDARLNKTRILWERRADGNHHGTTAYWLPGTDCAVAVTGDYVPASESNPEPTNRSALLFFNFEKSLSARTLLTSPDFLTVNVSLTRPVYFLTSTASSTRSDNLGNQATVQFRRGDAQGILGTPLTATRFTQLVEFNENGTAIYGVVDGSGNLEAKNAGEKRFFEWDGKSTTLTSLPSIKTKEPTPVPTVLPFSTQTAALSVPSRTKAGSVAMLHLLFLEATDTATDAPNHSLLIAPDATKSYLLADKSAVLYEVRGALYAVPLIHLSPTPSGKKIISADDDGKRQNDH